MGLLKRFSFQSKRSTSETVTRDIRIISHETQLRKRSLEGSLSENPSAVETEVEESDEDDPEPSRILIGIDFGTTYSGVSWAYSKQTENIKTITDWNDTECTDLVRGKAPTRIVYGVTDADTNWGYGIHEGESAEWFKLLLLDEDSLNEEQKESPQIKKAKKLLQKVGKSPLQAAADYLRYLWAHTIQTIENDFGEAKVATLPFRVVLTVPTVWTPRATDRMMLAAKEAGILWYRRAGDTSLHFVSEPEAAALATFDDLKTQPKLDKGDTFIVCDAGGGTVDLVSYKVHRSDPVELVECVKGSGKLCGGIFLDQVFEALLKRLIGSAWDDVSANAINRLMSSEWEYGLKRAFDGHERTWKVKLPSEFVERGVPPEITLEGTLVKQTFDSIVSQIQTLANDHINDIKRREGQLPKAVLLVGGFGGCKYLYNLLNAENKYRGIEVYQSKGIATWTAVCRGAVLKASQIRDHRLPWYSLAYHDAIMGLDIAPFWAQHPNAKSKEAPENQNAPRSRPLPKETRRESKLHVSGRYQFSLTINRARTWPFSPFRYGTSHLSNPG